MGDTNMSLLTELWILVEIEGSINIAPLCGFELSTVR